MTASIQRLCTWSGPAFVVVFFGGILAAGWLPPVSANMNEAEVAAMYREDGTLITLGAVMIGSAGLLQGVWAALMSRQMLRIEGRRPLFTMMQLVAGGVGILVPILPAFCFALAAFRPDRDPAITQAFHDFGWFMLVGLGWPAILQCLAVGGAALSDRSSRPVFPRWFGWFNLWIAFAFLPGPFLVFFHTGPFAWHGAIAFWLPATVFGAWFAAWFVVLRRAIDQEEADDRAAEVLAPDRLLREEVTA